MTSTPAWHQRCTLQADVRNNTLTLAEFAADLNDVRTGTAPQVYRVDYLPNGGQSCAERSPLSASQWLPRRPTIPTRRHISQR